MGVRLNSLLVGTLVFATIGLVLQSRAQGTAATESGVAVTGDVPVSPEAEAAPQEPPVRFSMMGRLRATGKTGLVQLSISIVALAFALERAFTLRLARVVPERLADQCRQLWSQGRWGDLAAVCEQSRSTLGRVISGLARHRQASAADASAYAGDLAGREMRHHLLRALPLAVAATVEPLLGLFGTVVGMVGAFESVALAGKMGDPSIMAEDISFALMTTVVGLSIAIPCLILYQFFRARTQWLSLRLEGEINELIAEWFLGRREASS